MPAIACDRDQALRVAESEERDRTRAEDDEAPSRVPSAPGELGHPLPEGPRPVRDDEDPLGAGPSEQAPLVPDERLAGRGEQPRERRRIGGRGLMQDDDERARHGRPSLPAVSRNGVAGLSRWSWVGRRCSRCRATGA